MKRLCCLIGLLFLGCNRAPQLVDQQVLGKDLASLHQASDPSLLVRINNRHARYLFEYESFAELDAFLTRAEKWDPVETLCTPLSMLDELRNTQDGGFPWMVYHSRQWMASAKHSEWAPAAEALAVMNQGERMCDLTGWNAFPPHNQGLELMVEAALLGRAIQKGHPGYPLIDYYRMVVEKSARQTILEAVRKYPKEIALYTYLATVLSNEPKADRNKHMKTIAREMPDCYALYFTLQLRGARRRLASGLWDWEALKVGFEKLLQEHPNALGVRNAYAVAAMVFEDKELATQQAQLLGYHWDPDFWGSLREYQEGLGTEHDYHLAPSSLPGLKLDEAISKQTRLLYPSWEAQCLLRKGQWVALEVFLRNLPQPELRHEAGEALEEGDEENDASYKRQEALLRDWQAARPDSALVQTALGGFYISYAWLARGSGYANTVSASGWEKFRERLETAAKFLNAPVNEKTDGLTLQHKMTMLLANSFDRESADRLALLAARRGREGAPALETYFSALLPRWHGEPGDLTAACDVLKKELGHDDAYYLMTGVALEYEGPEAVLDPGHPVSISWKRALNSYLDAQKAGRSTSGWAHKMLWYAYWVGQRAGAGALLPYLPKVDEPGAKEWPICLPGTRLWAEGKLDPVAWKRQKITCRRIGANRQKASPGARLGVEVKANAPLLFGSHFYLLIHSPTQTNKKGFQYQDCAVMADLRPFVDTSARLTLEPERAEEIQPGTYDLKLYEDGEVIYTDHYELRP